MKPIERAYVLLKNGTRHFQNRNPFERLACFYVIISEDFERLKYFNFETDFLVNENLFLKDWSTVFYKTVTSEANVKTNSTVSTKCTYHTYHKKRNFANNYFIFFEILFQFKNLS